MQAKNEVSSVVRKILSLSGMTHAQMASVLGVPDDRVTSLATGKVKKFHPNEVLALIGKMKVKKTFIETGEGEVFESEYRSPEVPVSFAVQEEPASYRVKPSLEDFVTVPHYDVQGSAGTGALIDSEQVVNHLAFRRDWVRNTLGVQQSDLALIEVRGDSMEPTLSNGDMILLDMRKDREWSSGIHVIRHDGRLQVKRLNFRINGAVDVISDNPSYPTESLAADELRYLEVVGRVVWAGRRM